MGKQQVDEAFWKSAFSETTRRKCGYPTWVTRLTHYFNQTSLEWEPLPGTALLTEGEREAVLMDLKEEISGPTTEAPSVPTDQRLHTGTFGGRRSVVGDKRINKDQWVSLYLGGGCGGVDSALDVGMPDRDTNQVHLTTPIPLVAGPRSAPPPDHLRDEVRPRNPISNREGYFSGRDLRSGSYQKMLSNARSVRETLEGYCSSLREISNTVCRSPMDSLRPRPTWEEGNGGRRDSSKRQSQCLSPGISGKRSKQIIRDEGIDEDERAAPTSA